MTEKKINRPRSSCKFNPSQSKEDETLLSSDVTFLLGSQKNDSSNDSKSVHENSLKKTEYKRRDSFELYEKFKRNDLEILEKIGRGSFGVVYKAWCRSLSKFVALKFLSLTGDSQEDEILMEEAENEKRIMERINKVEHKHILKFYRIFADNGITNLNDGKSNLKKKSIVLMLEYGICSMEDILMFRPRYEESEIIYIIKKIVNGLLALKKENIAHRDLKPKNLILADNMTHYKIGDFGISCEMKPGESLLPDVSPIGTPLYMPPEIQKAQLNSSYNPYATDIYSLGIIVMRMMGVKNEKFTKLKEQNSKYIKGFEIFLDEEIRDKFHFIYPIVIKMIETNPLERITLEQLDQWLNEFIGPIKFIQEFVYVKIFEEKMNIDNKNEDEKEVYYYETAETYMKIGWYTKALEFYKKSLEMKYILGAAETLKAGYNMSEIGQVYQNLKDCENSLSYYSKSEKIIRRINPDDLALGNILRQKGRVWYLQGQFDMALEYFERSMRFLKNLDESGVKYRLKYSQLLIDKGRIFLKLGLLNEALENSKEGYEIQLEMLGEKNHTITTAMSVLGRVYSSIQKDEEAYKLLKSCLDLRLIYLGACHHYTSLAYENMGNHFFDKGNYAEALSNFSSCFLIRKEIFGDEHILSVLALENLAKIYNRTGRYDETISIFQNSIKVKKRTFSKNHFSLGETYYENGLLWKNKGNLPEAIYNFEKSLEIYEINFGDMTNNKEIILNELKEVLIKRSDEVIQKCEKYKIS